MNDMSAVRPLNGSFSLQLPTLQIIIDQTSLGLFKECPRKYYYRMIEGWTTRATNVHLLFGGWFHEAMEKYEHAKAKGATHQEALRAAVRHALSATWNKVLNKPWNSEHKDKNRLTLVRSIVSYLDHNQFSRFKTITLSNGKPAVELTFKYVPRDQENGDELTSITGEPIIFSGHLDAIINFEEGHFILDHKTTTRRLDQEYFSDYTPDNQFSMYTHAGKWAFHADIQGVMCNAIQVTSAIDRFGKQVIYRSEPQLREWYADTKYYVGLMGRMAESNRWPMNDKACYRCPYRPICARPPGARQKILELDYMKSTWDPSVARGE